MLLMMLMVNSMREPAGADCRPVPNAHFLPPGRPNSQVPTSYVVVAIMNLQQEVRIQELEQPSKWEAGVGTGSALSFDRLTLSLALLTAVGCGLWLLTHA